MNVLWLQSGGCGGCSMSLLCADTADFPAMLKSGGIELLWHPSLSLASGRELIALLEDCRDGRTKLDVLCVEGSLLRGPNGTGRFHVLAGTGLPMIDWVRALAAAATHVVAVGSCAAWGGITATGPNVTDACGLQYDGDRPGGLVGRLGGHGGGSLGVRRGTALQFFGQRSGHSCGGFAPENHERPERCSGRTGAGGDRVRGDRTPRSTPSRSLGLIPLFRCPCLEGRESLAQRFTRLQSPRRARTP